MSAVIQPGTRVRPMQPADLIGVIAVESESYDYPWSRRIFEDCLQVGYCCLVAEDQGLVQGHGIMMVRAHEAHILNLCVGPSCRRGGIAGELLHNMLSLATATGADTAFLEVRPSNAGAIALYESNGFHEVGRRPDYYPSAFGREEAVVMARELIRD